MEASTAALATSHDRPRASALIGRTFVNPLVDYLFVGGGITLPIFAALYFFPWLTPVEGSIPVGPFLAINAAHFAASTLRLYTKPGARQEFPFLSWGFPVVCLAAVGAGLNSPRIGHHLEALYFTWSPYHYAAQTYGLAVMYAMRSGARLGARDKNQIWWVCLLPFLYSFFTSQLGGLSWFVSRETIAAVPVLDGAYRLGVILLIAGVFLLPVSLFWQLHRMRGRNVPLISLLMQVTNGMWWLGSDYLNAWFWTAIFHSIQYLLIVTLRHADDRIALEKTGAKVRPRMVYGSTFYVGSIVLGVLLFFVVPLAYVPLGFKAADCLVMMTFVINIHHFIVDGFIWRTKPPSAAGSASLDRLPVPA